MRSSLTLAAAAAAFFASAAAQGLSKPYITDPDMNSREFYQREIAGLNADLPTHSYRTEDWDNNYIPKVYVDLWDRDPSFSYSVWDVETKNVFFSDCPHASAISRHKASVLSWDQILTKVSKMPVGFRQYMSNLLVVPGHSLSSAAAFASGAAQVVRDTYLELPVLLHEGVHVLDYVALPGIVAQPPLKGRYSESQLWAGAYSLDNYVISSGSRFNQIENFAETGKWAISDITRGLESYTTKKGQVINQLSEARWRLERLAFPAGYPAGGTCTGKVWTAQAVDKRTGARAAAAEGSRIAGGRGREPGWLSRHPEGSEAVPIIELPEDFDWTPRESHLLANSTALATNATA